MIPISCPYLSPHSRNTNARGSRLQREPQEAFLTSPPPRHVTQVDFVNISRRGKHKNILKRKMGERLGRGGCGGRSCFALTELCGQGDEGDYMYIIERGVFRVVVNDNKVDTMSNPGGNLIHHDNNVILVGLFFGFLSRQNSCLPLLPFIFHFNFLLHQKNKTRCSGLFGELALMFNHPRTASIIAEGPFSDPPPPPAPTNTHKPAFFEKEAEFLAFAFPFFGFDLRGL